MEDETVRAICLSKRGDYSATTSYLHGKEHHKDFHPRTDLRDSATTLPKAHQQIFSDPYDWEVLIVFRGLSLQTWPVLHHTGFNTPDILEAEVPSILYYSSPPWLPNRVLPWTWLPKSAGRKKKKSVVPLLPRLYSCQSSSFCHWEHSQKLSQHQPYLILTSLCIDSTSPWLVGCSRHLRSLQTSFINFHSPNYLGANESSTKNHTG